MGKVFLGHRPGEERELAIKILHSDVSRNAEALRRFQREAKIAYALRHPNIMEVLDQGCDGDTHYIVMEYVPGPDLQVLIDRGQFPAWEQSVQWTIALLQALQHAHDQGVVHRDIKPANVLLSQTQEVLLTDFGVAFFREGTRLTSEGALIGTPEYMAPELFQNTEVDAKVDVYGCALILYELLTGRHPFRGGSITETIKSVLFKPLERPHNPEVPGAISDLLFCALSRSPEERPTAGQLAQRLH
jgi:serine/threonine protein kinase